LGLAGEVSLSLMKLLCLVAIFGCLAAAPATMPSEESAEVYRKGFAQIDKLSEEDSGRIGTCGSDGCWVVTTPLDVKSADLLARQKETIALLRRAATMPAPQWDFKGDSQKLVEVANHQPRLASLMVLCAREGLKDAKPQAAVENFMTGFAVARHAAATQPTILTKMTEEAAARPVIDGLAAELPSLPREIVTTLPAQLDALPKSSSFADVLRGEYEFAKATTARQGFMASALAAGLKDFYATLEKNAHLPPDKFDALIAQQMKDHPQNMGIKTVGPAVKGSRRSSAMLEAKQAMLATAIDIELNGESAAARSKDPFGDGAFAYHKTPGGFELQSALIVRDKPIRLRVGK